MPLPERLLDSWRDWGLDQRPQLIGLLGGGRTNRSYRLRAGARDLVLRCGNPSATELGIDRGCEIQILHQVSAAGLAPALVYHSPSGDLLLTEHVDGLHWESAGLNTEQRCRLLGLLTRVHAVTPDLPRFDYRAQAEAYWQHLRVGNGAIDEGLYRERERMLPLLTEFQAACHCNGLCHHDPGAANVIVTETQLWLIDWEYAGLGCRGFDYAALSAQWGLQPSQLGAAAGDLSCDLELAAEVYRYLCLLWEALRPEVR